MRRDSLRTKFHRFPAPWESIRTMDNCNPTAADYFRITRERDWTAWEDCRTKRENMPTPWNYFPVPWEDNSVKPESYWTMGDYFPAKQENDKTLRASLKTGSGRDFHNQTKPLALGKSSKGLEYSTVLILWRQFFAVRQMTGDRPQGLPAGQGCVAGVFKQKFQRGRFDVAIAKDHVGFGLKVEINF